ncbi:hypothetical protein FOCC_FOCC005265 [Frankliniella occidentalis]|nr:hypothetical protein FOCC_FOCC005265 [Frankliniella occidentalis]
MIMESVMDFSSTNSSSNASSPRGDTSPSVKQAQPPTSSPPLTPPRDATPTNNNNINNNNNNNNNNNINSKELEGPMALIQSHAPHGGPHGPMGPHGPPHGAPHGPPHPMAPPHPMSPMRHLGPPGLGLFNSLMGSPLEFMAAAQAQAQAQAQHGHQGHPGHPQHPGGHPHPPRSYNSPPPISSSDPTANECKLVNYRGQKVAAFMINGETMLCLPQAFELFLKHLVGGLHTVYTKLKRLDIVPLVCNVEQVRILRGLGAIQPGVNRCKLLSCKDFDSLYRDCTTASRPGRPTKRVSMGLALPASLQGHPQIKKHRLENGDMFENGHLGGEYWETCRAAYEDIVKHLERIQQERGEAEAIDNRPRDLTSHNGSPNGHSPVLNLSKGGGSGGGAGSQSGPSSHADHSDSDACASDKDDDDDDAISNPEDDDEAQPTAELKMDVVRERELKESLERQLVDETRTRMLWQKRLQKERKARRRLQEQLELEMKRRAQLEEALRGAVGSGKSKRVNRLVISVFKGQYRTGYQDPNDRVAFVFQMFLRGNWTRTGSQGSSPSKNPSRKIRPKSTTNKVQHPLNPINQINPLTRCKATKFSYSTSHSNFSTINSRNINKHRQFRIESDNHLQFLIRGRIFTKTRFFLVERLSFNVWCFI